MLSAYGDERLVSHVRGGNAAAFEVLYDRHYRGLLSFSRHMLGSREEAEDAVQLVFVSAHQSILRDGRQIEIKPWLYAIARNRCLSLLRARRDHASEMEGSTAGLHDEVERRSDLRELVADLLDLPEDQRAALVLTELRDLSHVEVAGVLGCEPGKMKGLVFRARSALIERREARAARCDEIRTELATARGGALRRGRLRHHLRACPSCTAFREDVRRQSQMMALVLPIVPTIGLKQSVMGALGPGGGAISAAGGGAAAGASALAGSAAAGPSVTAAGGAALGGGSAASGAVAAGGVAAGLAAPLTSVTLAKVLTVAVVAGGAGAAGIGVAGSDDPPVQRAPAGQGQPAAPRPAGHLRPAGPEHGSPTPGGGRSRRSSTEEPPGETARAKGRNGEQGAASDPGRTGERGSSSARRRVRGEGRAGPGARERGSSNARGRRRGEERAGRGGSSDGGPRRAKGHGHGKPVTTKQRTKGRRKAPSRGRDKGRPGTPPPPRKRGPKRPSTQRPKPQGKARPKARDLPSQIPDPKGGPAPK